MFKEELARLYLCGDGFADGELAKVLDHTSELRDNLLEILCEIGALLIRGKYSYQYNPNYTIFHTLEVYQRPKSVIREAI